VRLLLLWLAAPLAFGATELDEKTGLVVAPGFEQVRAQCTACHSARLVTQNRADRDGWLDMIRWMQASQGLWPLGGDEALILDYLADNYGPVRVGRRPPQPPELLPPP
jgi:hypothetical protein